MALQYIPRWAYLALALFVAGCASQPLQLYPGPPAASEIHSKLLIGERHPVTPELHASAIILGINGKTDYDGKLLQDYSEVGVMAKPGLYEVEVLYTTPFEKDSAGTRRRNTWKGKLRVFLDSGGKIFDFHYKGGETQSNPGTKPTASITVSPLAGGAELLKLIPENQTWQLIIRNEEG